MREPNTCMRMIKQGREAANKGRGKLPQSNERAARRKAGLTLGAGKVGMNWTDKEKKAEGRACTSH